MELTLLDWFLYVVATCVGEGIAPVIIIVVIVLLALIVLFLFSVFLYVVEKVDKWRGR